MSRALPFRTFRVDLEDQVPKVFGTVVPIRDRLAAGEITGQVDPAVGPVLPVLRTRMAVLVTSAVVVGSLHFCGEE